MNPAPPTGACAALRVPLVVTASLVVAAALLVPTTALAHRDQEGRLARLERVLGSDSLLRMQETLERMERELRQLRGEIELQGHRLSRLERTQAEGARSVTPGGNANGTGADGGAEAGAYREAFGRLQARDFEGAAAAFQGFLGRFPSGDYAPRAIYWLGESHYALSEYDRSIEQFERLIAQHTDSPKFTHALLKLGFAHDELGQGAKARGALERLVAEFPDSETAALARQRLANLKSE